MKLRPKTSALAFAFLLGGALSGLAAPGSAPTPAEAAKSSAAAAASASSARAAVNLPLGPRFAQIRARIDALFAHRGEAVAAPDPRTNPFRPPGTLVAAKAEGGAPPQPNPPAVVAPASDLALLQQSAATLKVSGIFEIGGTSHLVINGRPYKAGDVVPAQVNGETVYVRVRTIAKPNVTLALKDAEMTINFDARPPSRPAAAEKKAGAAK